MNRGYFVTATGTDVGKTFVTALLVKKWRDSGMDAGYYKAALSGAEFKNGHWVAGDADYVKNFAGLSDSQEELVSYVYKEAVSPHLAARKEGNPVELSRELRRTLKRLQNGTLLCSSKGAVESSARFVMTSMGTANPLVKKFFSKTS